MNKINIISIPYTFNIHTHTYILWIICVKASFVDILLNTLAMIAHKVHKAEGGALWWTSLLCGRPEKWKKVENGRRLGVAGPRHKMRPTLISIKSVWANAPKTTKIQFTNWRRRSSSRWDALTSVRERERWAESVCERDGVRVSEGT